MIFVVPSSSLSSLCICNTSVRSDCFWDLVRSSIRVSEIDSAVARLVLVVKVVGKRVPWDIEDVDVELVKEVVAERVMADVEIANVVVAFFPAMYVLFLGEVLACVSILVVVVVVSVVVVVVVEVVVVCAREGK